MVGDELWSVARGERDFARGCRRAHAEWAARAGLVGDHLGGDGRRCGRRARRFGHCGADRRGNCPDRARVPRVPRVPQVPRAEAKGIFLSLSSVIKGVIVVAVLGGVGAGAVHVQRSRGGRVASQHSPTRSAPALVPAAAPALTSRDATSFSDAEPSRRADRSGSLMRRARRSAVQHSPRQAWPRTRRRRYRRTSRHLRRFRAEPELTMHPGVPRTRAQGRRRSSRLREESAAVLAIRRALLAGNAREALALLARARADFPRRRARRRA